MRRIEKLYREFCRDMLTQITTEEDSRQGWFDAEAGLCGNLRSYGEAQDCGFPTYDICLYQERLFERGYGDRRNFPFDADFWAYLESDTYTNPARLAHLRRFAA